MKRLVQLNKTNTDKEDIKAIKRCNCKVSRFRDLPKSKITTQSNTFKMILPKTIDLWLSLDSVLSSLSLIRGTIVAMSKTAYMSVDQ